MKKTIVTCDICGEETVGNKNYKTLHVRVVHGSYVLDDAEYDVCFKCQSIFVKELNSPPEIKFLTYKKALPELQKKDTFHPGKVY